MSLHGPVGQVTSNHPLQQAQALAQAYARMPAAPAVPAAGPPHPTASGAQPAPPGIHTKLKDFVEKECHNPSCEHSHSDLKSLHKRLDRALNGKPRLFSRKKTKARILSDRKVKELQGILAEGNPVTLNAFMAHNRLSSLSILQGKRVVTLYPHPNIKKHQPDSPVLLRIDSGQDHNGAPVEQADIPVQVTPDDLMAYSALLLQALGKPAIVGLPGDDQADAHDGNDNNPARAAQ